MNGFLECPAVILSEAKNLVAPSEILHFVQDDERVVFVNSTSRRR
jgi:hypothetical protein